MHTIKPSDKRVLLFTLLVFLAALALAFVFRDILRAIVLTPILYLFWIANLAYQSFDQGCIWAAALLIAFSLSPAFLRRTRKPAEAPPLAARRAAPAGRIRFWHTQVQAQRGPPYGQFRAAEIRQLATQVFAYREHTRVGQIKEQMQAGQLNVPTALRPLLGLEAAAAALPPLRWSERLRGWWAQRRSRSDGDDPQVEQLADYLENLMEIEDDIQNR